jgi:hypothetical protein
MMRLTANLPEVLTEAVIVPAPVATVETDEAPSKDVPMRRDDEVEAWARVHCLHYGTPARNLHGAAAAGKHLLLDIDVQGTRQVKRAVLSRRSAPSSTPRTAGSAAGGARWSSCATTYLTRCARTWRRGDRDRRLWPV